jgi:hypothetical protein
VGLPVDADEFHGAGTRMAAAVSSRGGLLADAAVVPAAADEVSVGVAQQLSTRLAVIAGHSALADRTAASAAAVVYENAVGYHHQEELNAAALRPRGGAAAVTAPSPGAVVSPTGRGDRAGGANLARRGDPF